MSKIADAKLTTIRREALKTLANLGFIDFDDAFDMSMRGWMDVQQVKDAIARSDNPAYFDQRFEFKGE
jgi:hypothetical protein